MATINNIKNDNFEPRVGERILDAEATDGVLKRSAGFLRPYTKPFIPTVQRRFMALVAGRRGKKTGLSLPAQVQRTGEPTGFSPLSPNLRNFDSFDDDARFANLIRKDLEDEIDSQGIVKINGQQVPGIFKGINFLGGIKSREFDKQRTQLKINGVRVSETVRVFQVDYGDKPITGTANFEMMDDASSAKAKAQEFVNIMTNDEGGEVLEADRIPRVFLMESYMNGTGLNGPLQFKRIKVINWGVGMPTGGAQGMIPCFFQFEQFEILKTETKKGKILTKKETTKK